MKVTEISKHLEHHEDKSIVASVKKILRAYEQTFSEDVDVLSVLGDIEQFFARMQDRYENAFTVRNILSGQQKLLDLPIVREKLSDSQYRKLQEMTRSRASAFTKTANDKQRMKGKVTEGEIRSNPETDTNWEATEGNTAMFQPADDAFDEFIFTKQEQTIEEQAGRIEEQLRQIDHLNATVFKLKSFIQAVKVILNLMD